MYVRMYPCMFVCIHACSYVSMYVRMYPCMFVCIHVCSCVCMGGDLQETDGRSLQNLRWGDGQCIRPPNIWRSSVMGCAGKYEVLKKVTWMIFLFWNRGQENDHIRYIRRWMTKIRSSKIFGVKMEFFFRKRSFENFVPETIFSVPPKLAVKYPPIVCKYVDTCVCIWWTVVVSSASASIYSTIVISHAWFAAVPFQWFRSEETRVNEAWSHPSDGPMSPSLWPMPAEGACNLLQPPQSTQHPVRGAVAKTGSCFSRCSWWWGVAVRVL